MSDRPVIPYGRQRIEDEDLAAVAAVLRGDWLTQGPAVAEFEAALSGRLRAPHAVAVSSGTAALHLGMLALGIGPGDLVVVPPITFVATANAALYCGADVAFVDVEAATAVMDPTALDAFLTSYRGPRKPRAVVAVHYAGLPADLVALGDVCRRHGVALIEDACHAPGAEWADGQGRIRTIGDASTSTLATLSFHPVKHLTTGEGGAVMTTDAELADKVRTLRTHGITRSPERMERNEGVWWYEQQALGFNYRMPDILAALGTSQLRRLDASLARRRAIAKRYREVLGAVPGIEMQAERPGCLHAYHLFPILVDHRAAVLGSLAAGGVRGQVHYIPVHQQPFYRARYGTQRFPNAERWYRREISIPMFHAMSDEDVTYVCDAIVRAVAADPLAPVR